MEIKVLLWIVIPATLMLRAAAMSCDVQDMGDMYMTAEHANSCYIFVMEKTEAKEARSFCRSLGGHLTDIVDDSTQTFLETFVKEGRKNSTRFGEGFWIGLFYSDGLDIYYWDSGAPDDSIPSLSTPGTFINSGTCVQLDDEFQWDNIGCNRHRRFICKLAKTLDDSGNETNCPAICKAALEKYWMISTPAPSTTTTPAPQNTTVNVTGYPSNDTDGAGGAGGEEGSGGEAEGHSGNQCREDDMQDIIVFSVLGAVLGASMLLNVILLCCCFCSQGKRKNTNPHDKPVSLVDILNADAHGTRGNDALNSTTTSPVGSTSELLYANDNVDKKRASDDVDRASKEKHGNKKTGSSQDRTGPKSGNSDTESNHAANVYEASENFYEDGDAKVTQEGAGNAKPIRKIDGYEEPEAFNRGGKVDDYEEPETLNRGVVMKKDSTEDSAQTYSKLDRDHIHRRELSNDEDVGHEYGMASASEPFSAQPLAKEVVGGDEYTLVNREGGPVKDEDAANTSAPHSTSDDTTVVDLTRKSSSVYETYT